MFPGLRARIASASILAIGLGLLVSASAAEGAGSATAVLARATERWKLGSYSSAERLYAEAIDRGDLSPQETLDCYVHLGTARVILGNAGDALQAFREAALIDPHFVLPREAGSRANALAQQARSETQRMGPYQISAEVPDGVAADQPFRVTAGLPKAQAAHIMTLRVVVKEPLTGKSYEKSLPAESSVAFEIPAGVAAGGETVSVRFDAMDEHDNRLASVERPVRIGQASVYVANPVATAAKLDKPDEETPKKSKSESKSASKSESNKPEEPAGEEGEASEGGEKAEGGAEGEGGGDANEVWNIPHGSKKYTAVRAKTPPVIDGQLDDPIWKLAPPDARFLSTRSKPYGQPTTEPTVVQVAYDDQNLYVAFRCSYSKGGAHDVSFVGDETSLLTESESVSVLVDAVHGHTGAYQFAVSPVGVRADAELSEQGSMQNLDWRGIWEVQTARTADGWTAEFRIPWGTMRMRTQDESFDVGINFTRREPISGEYELWALHPPATELFDITFFGHLDGLTQIHPGQRLFLQPYLALGYDSQPLANQSPLSSIAGTNPRVYLGGYARFRPPGPVQVDATINPDFSAVTPDQTLANFDRFELEYPENRPFFAEDTPRFQFGAPRYLFGDLGAQLFYSRRVGIDTNTAGLTEAQPLLWGVKSVLRTGGTEAAVMNVESSPATGPIAFADNDTVARVTQTFLDGQRVGAIVLARGGTSGSYLSGGVDGAATLYDRHLEISGFFAGSQLAGVGSAAGEGTVSFKSQDVYAKATYLDIGSSFDAPLGYFPLTGVRAEMFAAGYSPVVRNDRVQQIFLDAQLSIVHDRATDAPIYTRGVVALTLATIEQALVQVMVMPASETIATAFPVGNGRIMVQPGTYNVLVTQFNLTTAPSRPVVFGLGYLGGDLYAGTRRAPSITLGLNLGRFTYKFNYTLYILKYGTDSFYGHDFVANASYSYTPLIKTTLLFEADSVAARATVQLATTAQFGQLSFLTLAMRGNSGSTIDVNANDWTDNPTFSAILSFAIGASPF